MSGRLPIIEMIAIIDVISLNLNKNAKKQINSLLYVVFSKISLIDRFICNKI